MNNEKELEFEKIDNFSNQGFENYIQELEKKFQDPNYDEDVNFGLPTNPTPTEEIKYDLCQKILAYQQDSKLSDEEIARRIGLNVEKVREIMYSHFHKFTLDELVIYSDKLFSPAKREITYS